MITNIQKSFVTSFVLCLVGSIYCEVGSSDGEHESCPTDCRLETCSSACKLRNVQARIRRWIKTQSPGFNLATMVKERIKRQAGNDSNNAEPRLPPQAEALIVELLSKIEHNRVLRANKETLVLVSVLFRTLVHVSKVNQEVLIDMWLAFFWNDEYFMWDPEANGHVYQVAFSKTDTWTPDYTINNINNQQLRPRALVDASVDVLFFGFLIYLLPVSVQLICDVSVTSFPFEQHTCDINITNNMLTIESMNMVVGHEVGGADSSAFSPNSEWGLVSFEGFESLEVGRPQCPSCVYPRLTFRFIIRRRWKLKFFLYYLPNLMLNIKTVCQFLLPIDSFERMKWASSTYLGTTFYLLTVRAVFSQSINLPIWVFYMALVTPLGGLAQIITILNLSFHFQGVHDNFRTVPAWARQLILGPVAMLVCLTPRNIPEDLRAAVMRGETMEISLVDDEDEQDLEDNRRKYLAKSKPRGTIAAMNVGETNVIAKDLAKLGQKLKMDENQKNKFQIVLYKILKHCEMSQEQTVQDTRMKVLRYEWMQLAAIVDRVAFFFYVFITAAIWAFAFQSVPSPAGNVIV